jgi:tetraacyldisaccharide 4'-kinase
MNALLGAGASLMEAAWEARRRLYARGVCKPRRVPSRVVSIGNLTTGGTGKTTLTLHLARLAGERGVTTRVVCRRYRPGPGGRGDEERMYQLALGESAVIAGQVKWRMAERAAREAELVLVDDGFSHWGLERDVDVVLVDALDPWGGGRMLPAGRLREPRRALQRAEAVVITRMPVGKRHWDESLIEDIRRAAPAAVLAGARHRVESFHDLAGHLCPKPMHVRVVTATGNPEAVVMSAVTSGCVVTGKSFYRDHHWFSGAEVERERRSAASTGSHVLLTAKDALRWPHDGGDERVMDVAWEWAWGGDEVERLVFERRS